MAIKSINRIIFTVLIFLILTPCSLAQSKTISLDFKSSDIKDVLRALANQEGVNILIDGEISQNISIQLNKVTFLQALDIITANNNLAYSKTDNVYRVFPVDNSHLKIDFAEGLLSLEAREVRLTKLLQELSQKTGVNLVPAPDLQEKVTLNMSRTPLREAIDALLIQTNCMEEKVGKVSFVRKKSTPALSITVNYQNNRLTVDAKNIPIAALCRMISEKSGVSVVPDQNLAANLTIFFQDLAVDDGLNVLCETNGLQLYKEGAARRIAKKKRHISDHRYQSRTFH